MNPIQITSLILSIISFGLILYIGLKTDLLKEGTAAAKPYSFHKFQLWVWTLVICPCFALHWGWHPDGKEAINTTSLILLGIAGGTALTAEIISSSQQKSNPEGASLKALNVSTTSFWSDILKDDSGQLSVGRLQQLIFTFIYVTIYIATFFPEMIYKTFGDNNPFILMGISTSTYLVGKGLKK